MADHLSDLMLDRIDRAVVNGLVVVQDDPNLRFKINLSIEIYKGQITHKLATSAGDVEVLPTGRIAQGQLLLPEFDKDVDSHLYYPKRRIAATGLDDDYTIPMGFEQQEEEAERELIGAR